MTPSLTPAQPGRSLPTALSGILLAAILALAGLLAASTPAEAANTRVSITDFQWSKNPQVDLGESVTWDWLGPDLQHSVTGQAPNATQWDSDPGNSMPFNALGHTYTVTFDQPGTYLFVCKLHSSVRGTVTVSDQPGDPDSDPGKQPPLNFDMEPPTVDDIFFTHDGQLGAAPEIGPKGKGIGLRFSTGEKGSAEVDYYRLVKQGKGKKAKTVRRFMGYDVWETHIGWNLVRFGARSATFKPVAGKYVGLFRVTDQSANSTAAFPLRFEVKPSKAALKRQRARERARKKRLAKKRRQARKKAQQKKQAAKKARAALR